MPQKSWGAAAVTTPVPHERHRYVQHGLYVTWAGVHAPTNSAIDAVKPCRKFFPPTGPISPAQLNPASGRPPSFSDTSDAS